MAMHQQSLGRWLPRAGAQDDLTDPVDEPDAEVVETVLMPEQERMLKYLAKMDYCGVVDAIDKAEKAKAVKYNQSRIGVNPAWKGRALFLLAQMDYDVLTSLIDGTLPQRALGGLKNNVRIPAGKDKSWQGKMDPVVYANFIADRSGKGLTCDELEHFLGACEVAASLKVDPTGKYSEGGRTVEQGVQQAYNLKRSAACKYNDFYSSVRSVESMGEVVKDIAKIYRRDVLPKARAAGCDHVMLRGEVGWSYKGYNRCEDHATLDEGSPAAFRLAQCVLMHLFPKRGFRLHQFVVFDIIDAVQAGIGESIASQMCASYTTCGGFNKAQAGVSVTEAWNMSTKGWMEVQAGALRKKYLKRVESNLQMAKEVYTARKQTAEDELRLHQLEEAVEAEEDGLVQGLPLLKAKHENLEQSIATLESALGELNAELSRLQEQDGRDEGARGALRELAEVFGVLVPSSRPGELS
ncbi:hypothetical protein LTR85_010140 [Meristemomyces frigidus]|nr:hypothetical protein LTR85_010140 [Meristemomyces frigidus]